MFKLYASFFGLIFVFVSNISLSCLLVSCISHVRFGLKCLTTILWSVVVDKSCCCGYSFRVHLHTSYVMTAKIMFSIKYSFHSNDLAISISLHLRSFIHHLVCSNYKKKMSAFLPFSSTLFIVTNLYGSPFLVVYLVCFSKCFHRSRYPNLFHLIQFLVLILLIC